MDAFPPAKMDLYQLVAFGLSGFSVAVSFLIASFHYVKPLRTLSSTVVEFAFAIMLYAFWIGSAFFILNPKLNIASTIDPTTGVESIEYSNIYILSWLTMLSNFYLVASYFWDVRSINFKMVCWILLFSTSATLFLMSFQLRDGICDTDDTTRCSRTKYIMSISGVLCLIPVISIVLYLREEITTRKSLFLESVASVLYVHGLVLCTSVSGPARSFGTIYFSAWIGSALSCLLLINSGHDSIINEADENKVEVSMGDHEPPSSPSNKSNRSFVH